MAAIVLFIVQFRSLWMSSAVYVDIKYRAIAMCQATQHSKHVLSINVTEIYERNVISIKRT